MTERPHHCDLEVIHTEGLGVRHGDQIVFSDVNLAIRCGQLTAVIGPNGAGKTTLVRCLMNQQRYEGAIRFSGHGGTSPTAAPRIGYVPQYLTFDRKTPLSVLDFLCCARSPLPVFLGHTVQGRRKAHSLLRLVDAEHLLHRSLGQLSGGELQRVTLAQALDPPPNLLLLDEPISGVDRAGTQRFYQLLSDLREHRHMATVLVSHDFDMVAQYADSVVLLSGGQAHCGAPKDIFTSVAYCEAFGRQPREVLA